jgi:hypothetical protein
MRPLLALSALTVATALAADIPIREVILYKSGVGYFAREGTLAAGESARLDFKASNMDDVLKSLTVTDKNGKVTGLHYDASQPLDQKLKDFPFELQGQSSLAVFFDQMKGARVEIRVGNETIAGSVLSGRVIRASDKTAEVEQVVLLLDSGELRMIDLASAGAIRFADAKLQAELKDYLGVLNQSRSRDLRSIYIDSSDAKARQIDASYMIPMPVWKSSYRLIFSDKGDPTLEGWAIVDNTTGEDWSNVRLAVVSGRPVSFISKLYEPKFVPRLTVDLPEDRAANPVLYGGAMGGGGRGGAVAAAAPPPPAAKAMDAARARAIGSLQMGASAGLMMNEELQPQRDALSSIAMNVAGEDLGDLFEYRFGAAITVKKDESAMLPFLQQAIGARKLLIYSESYGEHPMSAAELTNSTGKTLDGGPITVFEGASYSGEALMATLKAADKRLVSYAVDLGTRITTKFDSSSNLVREIHVNRGVLTARIAEDQTKTYTIRNVDARPKTLIIEQAKRPDYGLLDQKPSETTTNAYRFEVQLGADGSQTFPVREERVYDTTTTVSNMTPDILLSYIQNKAISDAGRRALQQIVDQKVKIADLDGQIHQAESDINATTADETRLRQNIQSLNQVSGQQDQVQNYARQLAAKEAQLASLRDRESDLKKQQAAQQTALNSMIQNLSF